MIVSLMLMGTFAKARNMRLKKKLDSLKEQRERLSSVSNSVYSMHTTVPIWASFK